VNSVATATFLLPWLSQERRSIELNGEVAPGDSVSPPGARLRTVPSVGWKWSCATMVSVQDKGQPIGLLVRVVPPSLAGR